jgi:hypothetical protein
LTVIAIPGCTVSTTVALAFHRSSILTALTTPTGLTILTAGVGQGGQPIHSRWRPSDDVQKSSSLTVAESWFSTVVFAGLPAVAGTLCFC